VTLALPYAAILAHIARPACDAVTRAALRVCLIVAFLMMASTSSELGAVLGESAHKYAQAYGLFGASALVALVALSLVLRQSRPAPEVDAAGLELAYGQAAV
jgi:hypothetical protein